MCVSFQRVLVWVNEIEAYRNTSLETSYDCDRKAKFSSRFDLFFFMFLSSDDFLSEMGFVTIKKLQYKNAKFVLSQNFPKSLLVNLDFMNRTQFPNSRPYISVDEVLHARRKTCHFLWERKHQVITKKQENLKGKLHPAPVECKKKKNKCLSWLYWFKRLHMEIWRFVYFWEHRKSTLCAYWWTMECSFFCFEKEDYNRTIQA